MNMITFPRAPGEHEAEKASNSYIMSLIAVIGGLPFPLINLLATLIFYLGNKKGTYFVRWHCTQALVSQFSLFLMNSAGFWWTMLILFSSRTITAIYVAYIITIIIYNITDLIASIYSAIKTRKGIHVEWWFYGGLTNLICRE